MKLHSKPPANHLQTAFRVAHPALFSLLFTLFSLRSPASVPLSWQVTPRNPAPVVFDRHHGETLEFRCVFSGFGELPFGQAADIRLWYQTNGMSAAWWSVPASVSSNVLSATFPPQADPGADRLALFFGAPSNAYASAVLRLRHSPGFAPNVLPAPEPGYTETDPVFSAWLTTTDLVHEEQDPTVPSWAKAETPPQTMTTDAVREIVTNEIATKYSDWTISPHLPPGVARYSLSYFAEFAQWELWLYDSDNQVVDVLDMAGTENDTVVTFPYQWAFGDISFTRVVLEYRNALGLARIIDLPPLTNDIPALIDSAIAAIPKPAEGRSWNRPGEWSMAYVPTLETESADLSEISTNEAYMVFSNYTARTVRGLSANVFPERVDPLSIEAPLPVVLSVPDGGTASGGVVSVPSNGLYRVRGVNTLGESREILVPFASGRIDERTVSVYVADKDGTARKLANDHAASVLAAMTDADEATYIGETNTFRVWRTLSPTFAWPGVGNTTPFALSPHVMVTAAHYPTWNIDRWTSNTLTNWVSGGTFSVRRGPSVHLADWAATNGFTAAEIALAGDLTDVAMIPLVEGEIPSECCPWLASVDWLAENYVNFEGICAWAITQGNAYWSPPANRNALLWAIPVILRGGSLTAANTWMAAGGIRPGMVARQDVADSIGQYNDRSWYEIRGGDSGKPVWICDFTSGARRDILISHFHTVGSGPNYAAALPILRAYCAAHGDTIKEIGND